MGLYQSVLLNNGLLQEGAPHYNYPVEIVFSGVTGGTFTLPSGVTSFTATMIGGGAAGQGGGADDTGYQGGGGGGFSQATILTDSGHTFNFTVGIGGDGSLSAASVRDKAGTHTTISSSTYVLLARASGGGRKDEGTYPDATLQQGGGKILYNENIGDVTYDGGNGASGVGSSPHKTGGGGGAAGTLGAGSSGTQSDGNRGVGSGGTGSHLYGGTGGNSYPVDTELGYQYGNGLPGNLFGGGGGGGASASGGLGGVGYGGDGADGILIISYLGAK